MPSPYTGHQRFDIMNLYASWHTFWLVSRHPSRIERLRLSYLLKVSRCSILAAQKLDLPAVKLSLKTTPLCPCIHKWTLYY